MERINTWMEDTFMIFRLTGESSLYPDPPASYLDHNRDKSPVILIPGFKERWGILKSIADEVSDRGHDVYTVPGLGRNNYSLDKSANIVDEIIKLHNLRNVNIIGFSWGGLIGKELLIKNKADKMIALSSPFLGSVIADSIPLKQFKMFSTKSGIVKYLSRYTQVNEKIISIYSQYDNLIPNGCYLDGAEDNYKVPGAKGHHAILEYDRVINYIASRLQKWEEDKAG